MKDELTEIEEKAKESAMFTDEQIEILHKVISAYRGVMALGKLGIVLTKWLAGVAAFILAYDTVISKIKEVLKLIFKWVSS